MNVKKIVFRKAVANASEAMAKALCMTICEAKYQEWLVCNISSFMSREQYNIKRMNALVFAKLNVLRVDIEALAFSDGQLSDIPGVALPTPPDYENLFKDDDEEYYSYQYRQAESFYKSFNNLVNMLMGFIEVITPPEGEATSQELAEFIQYLVDCNYTFKLFLDSIPYLLEFAWRKNILKRPKSPLESIPPIPDYYSTYLKGITEGEPVRKIAPFAVREGMQKVAGPECFIKGVANDKLGIVIGIVLEPGTEKEPDLQKQWISAENIEVSCYEYMEKFGTLGYMHTQFNKKQGQQNPDFRLLENYIVKDEDGVQEINGYKLKKGTWIQTWKILNPKLKEGVLKGELTGFSVGGYAFINDGAKKKTA